MLQTKFKVKQLSEECGLFQVKSLWKLILVQMFLAPSFSMFPPLLLFICVRACFLRSLAHCCFTGPRISVSLSI